MAGVVTTPYADGPEESFMDGFSTNFQIALQQENSPIWDSIMTDDTAIDKGYLDRVEAAGDADVKTSRNESHNVETPEYSRRILTWQTIYKSQQHDIEDIKRMGKDPTNVSMRNLAATIARKRDQLAIDAFFADVVAVQNDAAYTVSFPAAQQIAVDYQRGGGGSNTNLNPEKILRACELMEDNFVGDDYGDMETKYIACSPSQYFALCTHADVKTIDSFDGKPITDAVIRGVAGFRLIKSNLLNTDGSGYRRVIAYTEKALAKTIKEGLFVRYKENDAKHYQPEIYVRQMVDAKRVWEERVVEIKCDETAAA